MLTTTHVFISPVLEGTAAESESGQRTRVLLRGEHGRAHGTAVGVAPAVSHAAERALGELGDAVIVLQVERTKEAVHALRATHKASRGGFWTITCKGVSARLLQCKGGQAHRPQDKLGNFLGPQTSRSL